MARGSTEVARGGAWLAAPKNDKDAKIADLQKRLLEHRAARGEVSLEEELSYNALAIAVAQKSKSARTKRRSNGDRRR